MVQLQKKTTTTNFSITTTTNCCSCLLIGLLLLKYRCYVESYAQYPMESRTPAEVEQSRLVTAPPRLACVTPGTLAPRSVLAPTVKYQVKSSSNGKTEDKTPQLMLAILIKKMVDPYIGTEQRPGDRVVGYVARRKVVEKDKII
jgi:hypothetical protein